MKNIFDIASVFTGHSLREKVKPEDSGDCFIIQVKDVDTTAVTVLNTPHKISSDTIPPVQLLQPKDILLLSKGATNKALLYNGQFSKAAAVSAFTIIRITSSHILPEFLAWYLNSPGAEEYFNVHRLRGATTFNLPKSGITSLPVPVLPLEKQTQMLNLIRQQDRYNKLVADIQRNVNLLIHQTLQKNLENS